MASTQDVGKPCGFSFCHVKNQLLLRLSSFIKELKGWGEIQAEGFIFISALTFLWSAVL